MLRYGGLLFMLKFGISCVYMTIFLLITYLMVTAEDFVSASIYALFWMAAIFLMIFGTLYEDKKSNSLKS